MKFVLAVALIAVIAAMGVATAATQPQEVASRGVRAPAHADVRGTQSAFPTWLKNLAREFLEWKAEHGEVAQEVATEALKEWLREEKCSNLLPAPFFCRSQVAHPKPVHWGAGYALSWNGLREVVWTQPRSPRAPVRLANGSRYTLTPGTLYWLTCYSRGDTVTDGGIRTNLWYRLPSGGWVNDGWLQTGTNNVIAGVGHC